MKYLKLFILMIAATAFSACSDDDKYNTESTTTVEFASSTLSVKENTGLASIPVRINGKRNGKIRISITTEGTGANAAQESTTGSEGDYMMTTKTLSVDCDTLTSEELNFEMSIFDDDIINPDRTLRMTLSVEGAQLGANSTCDITIANNERTLYDLFAGDYTMTFQQPRIDDNGYVKDDNGNYIMDERTCDVTLKVVSDETSSDYGKRIFARADNILLSPPFNGATSLSWTFNYSYDETAKKGTLSFNCSDDDIFFSTNGINCFWQVLNGEETANGEITACWTPTEENKPAKRFAFTEGGPLLFVGESDGVKNVFTDIYNIMLTKK